MKRRKPRLRDGEPAIHTNRWVLKFENAAGRTGYFFGIGGQGLIVLEVLRRRWR